MDWKLIKWQNGGKPAWTVKSKQGLIAEVVALADTDAIAELIADAPKLLQAIKTTVNPNNMNHQPAIKLLQKHGGLLNGNK